MNVQKTDYQSLRSILVAIVGEATWLFKDNPAWQDRKGGYFCLADGKTGKPLFEPTQVGPINPEKAEKYYRLCQEKARRLAEHPTDTSSYQSRNPDANQWGGAVRLSEGLIYSFSGFPEHGDEAVMLILASIHLANSPTAETTARLIAIRSENPYWERLRGFLGRMP